MRGCAFCDMSRFPQSNSAEAQQSAQCLMRFAATVFFSVAIGSARTAELVEVFPLHTSSTQTVGEV